MRITLTIIFNVNICIGVRVLVNVNEWYNCFEKLTLMPSPPAYPEINVNVLYASQLIPRGSFRLVTLINS